MQRHRASVQQLQGLEWAPVLAQLDLVQVQAQALVRLAAAVQIPVELVLVLALVFAVYLAA